MATVLDKINYYPCDGGYMIGNGTMGSGSNDDLSNIDVVFKETIEGQPVIKISREAFRRKPIKSIALHSLLKVIEYRAFDTSWIIMNELIIPDSVKIIDWYAFSQNSIKKFVIGKGLERIGFGAFSDNLNLERIEYWQSVGGQVSPRVKSLIKQYKKAQNA